MRRLRVTHHRVVGTRLRVRRHHPKRLNKTRHSFRFGRTKGKRVANGAHRKNAAPQIRRQRVSAPRAMSRTRR